MKTIFDERTRNGLKNRINSLTEKSTARWGKMNVSQMMKHCSLWDEMAFGKIKYKQSFLGKLFGKMALKSMMKDSPIKKSLPTIPSFKITDDLNFKEEKSRWLNYLDQYENYTGQGIIHPFFGFMSKEQVGQVAYKHINHHLLQYNS
jgi:hypothetical protein